MTRIHLDADFFIKAVSAPGLERDRLFDAAESDALIQMSVIAWYEFARGPRTPEHLALASLVVEEEDVLPFDAHLAQVAAETFRRLGSPRRRANDIAIGPTAAADEAELWTLNASDFEGVPNLRLGPV
jgi:predicted nucleic acid-binding protein